MGLNISPSTSIERKLLVTETILNSTDKVSKVSDESILSGIAGGVSKVSGKAEKDIILAVSQLFPDSAFSDQLDQVAQNFGIAPRFGALGSSAYVRLSATPGTVYIAGTNNFSSDNGINFELESNITVSTFGFAYAKVRSTDTGNKTRVDSLSISKVSPAPNGHLNVINEYKAEGGRDQESDEIFRVRIKDGANILARGTLAMLEQVFIATNSNVLKIYNRGYNQNGKIIISVATQNGANLNTTELGNLLTAATPYFTLSEQRPFGSSYFGIALENVTYGFVDVSFRVQLEDDADPDEVRKTIQVNMSKYIDFRFFDPSKQNVEWDNLLDIVKNTPGVKYVPDQYFYPRADISFGNIIPRMRGFLMLDIDGVIISNFQGTLSPIFYPDEPDFSFQASVLNII